MTALSADRLPGEAEVLEKASSENFPVALRFLRGSEREDLMAVYGYARLVDDVGDELVGDEGDRLAALDLVESELDRAFGGTATHPVFRRLAVSIARRGLERAPLADLIEANRLDQSVKRYETFEQLLGYCQLSANPVGRLVLAIFDQRGAEREELSDLICTALQLAEHFQDVGEDAARGRVYLPAEDINRFAVPPGLFEGDPRSHDTPPSFRRLMAYEVTRARQMLLTGSRLVSLLSDRRASLAIAGFAGGGLAQLSAIERAGYDVLGSQVKASKAKVAASALSFVTKRPARRLVRSGPPRRHWTGAR